MYQMVFPVYTVLLAFCGGGITGAVSRVVAKYEARGDGKSASRAVRVALGPLLIVSAASTAAVMLMRNIIARVQGNPEAGLCYLALAPSLLFAGGIGVLRGYFQGRNRMVTSGTGQLIEQTVKLSLGLYLGKVFMRYGVRYAVAGALLGVTASEAVALIFLAVAYGIMRRKRYVRPTAALKARAQAETSAEFTAATDKQLRHELYSFALPVTLGSLVLPMTQLIDSALVINLLMYGGVARTDATALFGLFVGPVGTLINMPTVVVLSLSVAFLPALTAELERGGDGAEATRSVAKWVFIFVIPAAVCFMLFPDRICSALYRRGLTDFQLKIAARILRVQAPTVFYAGVLHVATTVLQAHGRAHRPVINLVIGASVKVALTPLTVRYLGIEGAAAATVACYGIAAALTARSAYKSTYVGLSIKNALVMPVVFTGLGAGVFILTLFLLRGAAIAELWKTVVAAVAFAVVYFGGISASGALDLRKFGIKRRRRKA